MLECLPMLLSAGTVCAGTISPAVAPSFMSLIDVICMPCTSFEDAADAWRVSVSVCFHSVFVCRAGIVSQRHGNDGKATWQSW
ncbi:hypothetical protein EV127DRAFT_448809 [Xylaria flabelliformis]|nr:hypothetical protein EV127DRAFT_448809 [Xylaria flabelliformis]